MVPTSRVDECALERLDAVDGGRPGLGEHAGGEDDDLAAHRSPVVGADGPVPVVLGPLGGRDLPAGSQVRPHPAVIGAPLEVLEDLGLVRVGLGPERIGGERERVEVGGHVARRTWIRVVPPGATDAVAAFEDHEVVDAVLDQSDAQRQTPDAGTDDHHAMAIRFAGTGHRIVRKHARISSTNRSGCSHAAKWPPWRVTLK